MTAFWSFLGHGGIRLLILAFILIGRAMKKSAEKAAQEQPQRPMPNSMPPQDAMKPNPAPGPQPVLKSAPKPKPQKGNSGSPWSSSSNPFNGKKK